MKVFSAFLALILFSYPICKAAMEPNETRTYKAIGETELSLHIFHPPGHKEGASYPAIVFFFGGGWVSGSPEQFYPQSRHLASRGMLAICADYRTENRHGTTPAESVKDGKSAMRWVREHAEELGIDPDRLAAGGGSAGGQVAAATALLDGFNEESEDTTISCRPRALVLFNPVIDNGPEGYGYPRVKDYWEAFSPLHNVQKGAPPTLLMLGTADELVPVATAESLAEKLRSVGTQCQVVLYDDQPHGFFNEAKYAETLAEMDRFLVSLGYLEPES